MAQSSVSRLDASERGSSDIPSSAQSNQQLNGETSLTKYAEALSASGEDSIAADLALDLVLHDILQRVCGATNATGGAIALWRQGEIVCRATNGEGVPELGVRLDLKSGLSAECVRGRAPQYCADTKTDPRVNASLCEQLEVRSIAVAPIIFGQDLLGIIEVLSATPQTFHDAEGEILRSFANEIAETVERAAELQIRSRVPDNGSSEAEKKPAVTVEQNENITGPDPEPRKRDVFSDILLASLILVSITLGWMLGRLQSRKPHSKSATPQSASVPAAGTSSQVSEEQPKISVPSPEDEPATSDGLVVSRNGKVVFRIAPGANSGTSAAVSKPGTPTRNDQSSLRLAPAIAESYLLTRVEPEYPEKARVKGIQGSVTLDAFVATNGSVEKLIAISGNPELIEAATNAVRQWKFSTFLHDGQPAEFVTRVTVIFRLPQ